MVISETHVEPTDPPFFDGLGNGHRLFRDGKFMSKDIGGSQGQEAYRNSRWI